MIDGNILVWIESASGEIYNEYEYKEPKTGRKECWIESKQSQNFRICWRFGGTTPHSIKSYIWLDGVQVSGGLLRSYEVHHTFRMSGCAIGSRKRLPFVFGRQQLTDDESSSTTDLEKLNTIRVAFEYVTFVEYTTDPPTPPKSRGAIHETVAKATPGDSAGLGDPMPSPLGRWCKTAKVPGLDRIEFVFHYAPYEWLLAREIVSGPRPSSPEKKPPEKTRPANELPRTPRKRKHTFRDLVYVSDSDSDVIIVDEGIAETPPKATSSKPPGKRRRSTPTKPKPKETTRPLPVTPSKSRPVRNPRPKPSKGEDVIDIASSDDDFEIK